MAKGKQSFKTKSEFRTFIKDLKAQYSPSQLKEMSEEVFSVVEITGYFQNAKSVFIYNSLPDEVATLQFVERWASEKKFFMPTLNGEEMIFRAYSDSSQTKIGALGINEPLGEEGIPKANDLIIVPGLAFDRTMNRLGRGKGYYDKYLTATKAVKMGVCFDFQLLDSIPTDTHDVKMDVLVSENDLIW